MSDFHKFATAIKARFDLMSKGELFTTVADRDTVWTHYLAAFPEGTNPIYRTRTEHDCSCCRHFVRNIGDVVGIIDGKLQSVWSVEGLEYPFNVVAKSLAELIEARPINGIFRSSERQYGNEETFERLPDGSAKPWNHFFATVADRHFTQNVGQVTGDYATTVQVFRRGLEELTLEALDTVIDLIQSKALYRGDEFERSVKEFRRQHKLYGVMNAEQKNLFVWNGATSQYSRFRNTAIGTLVQDLSAGVDLEAAVRSFESKVAPTNYKRPTALITPAMIKQAMATIEDLGLESALHRRFSTISDISVNNVLWVDNSVKGKMKGGIEEILLGAVTPSKVDESKARDISIDDFMANIAAKAQAIDLLVKNSQQSNFMSLTAPQNPDSAQIFKWNNGFAWSYDGNITDSIKEKVKRAGGNVDAKLRVSLAWFNYDDLDIHVFEPNGTRIYFAYKAGKLDVDMNAGSGSSRQPVENVAWKAPLDGTYIVMINQYNQRETTDVGFVVEVENNGQITQLSYPKTVKGNVHACNLRVLNGKVVELIPGEDVIGGGLTQEKWGIKTESFTKVNTIVASPNYWDDNQTGNKHWFFILDGCRNDQPARGIYNEFLDSRLDKHRKVFEVLGDKTKCQPTDDQLSGVGFSSTKGDSVLVRVTGNSVGGTYNITF